MPEPPGESSGVASLKHVLRPADRPRWEGTETVRDVSGIVTWAAVRTRAKSTYKRGLRRLS